MSCVFCDRVASGDVMVANELAAAFHDAFPLSPGHTLVVPRRHEADYFALTVEELAAMWRLVGLARERLQREQTPDGWNLGVNVGAAGGQTVGHAHIHLIPRHAGDVDDPRGGIRWIIPARVAYWEQGGRGR